MHHKQGEEHLVLPSTCVLKQNPNETDFPSCAMEQESRLAYTLPVPSSVYPVYLDLKHLRAEGGTVCP